MANFENLTTTDDGIDLMTAGLAGGPVVFYRMEAGSGEITDDTELVNLSALVNKNMDMPLTKWEDSGQGVLTLTGVLRSRDNPGPAFQWRELGVIANVSGGPDVLFSVANAYNEFDSIPDLTGPAVVLTVTVKVVIDRSISVTVVVGSSTDIDAINIGPAYDPVEDREQFGWFAQKVGPILEFKRLALGDGLEATDNGSLIELNTKKVVTFPIGGMIPFGGLVAPIDWLMCDGLTYDIALYPALFAELSNRFGGDGITTFAVPDFRGRSPIGAGQGAGLTNRPLASIGGAETSLLTIAEIPSHTHNDSGHLHPDPGHNHPDPGHSHPDPGHNHPDPGHVHGYVDPGHPHPTNRAVSVNDVYNTSASGWGGDWASGNLLWSNNNTSGGSISVSGTGIQAAFTGLQAAGTGIQAAVTGLQAGYAVLTPTGGGAAHNNMSPYLSVNYIIRST